MGGSLNSKGRAGYRCFRPVFHDVVVSHIRKRKAEVDTRRASAEQELVRLDAEENLIEQAELETASLVDYCTRVRSELQRFTIEEKRRALEALNITVVWHLEEPPEIRGSIPVHIVSNAL